MAGEFVAVHCFASHYVNCLLGSVYSYRSRSSRDSGEVHFVRGEKQYLFDEKGEKYLDIVNSTPHGKPGKEGRKREREKENQMLAATLAYI